MPAVAFDARAEAAAADYLLAQREQIARVALRTAPPDYITKELGERPGDRLKAPTWDEAAERIEGYRKREGIGDRDTALGRRPEHDRDRRDDWDYAARAADAGSGGAWAPKGARSGSAALITGGSAEIVAKKLPTSIPRIALTPPEAAAAIGVGPDFFDANVAPELRIVRRGRKRLVPVTELERWTAENAERALGERL